MSRDEKLRATASTEAICGQRRCFILRFAKKESRRGRRTVRTGRTQSTGTIAAGIPVRAAASAEPNGISQNAEPSSADRSRIRRFHCRRCTAGPGRIATERSCVWDLTAFVRSTADQTVDRGSADDSQASIPVARTIAPEPAAHRQLFPAAKQAQAAPPAQRRRHRWGMILNPTNDDDLRADANGQKCRQCGVLQKSMDPRSDHARTNTPAETVLPPEPGPSQVRPGAAVRAHHQSSSPSDRDDIQRAVDTSPALLPVAAGQRRPQSRVELDCVFWTSETLAELRVRPVT